MDKILLFKSIVAITIAASMIYRGQLLELLAIVFLSDVIMELKNKAKQNPFQESNRIS